ncbi:MAG: DUF6690 family protein [Lacipirellulaceae bacterium]
MLPKTARLAGMLGAAVGVPYAVSNAPDDWSTAWPGAAPQPAAEAPADPQALAPAAINSPEGPGANVYRSHHPLEGPRNLPLQHAFRWDVTREWVYQQWARKSTGLADPTLYGIRVPLVTGAAMTDLAGSLSYYFDAQGVLQRIQFHGRTADTNEVARLAVERFGMQRRMAASPGDQLYQAAEGNRVRSELRTRPEGTLWSTSPHESFLVDLELNLPGGPSWPVPAAPTLDFSAVQGSTPAAGGPQAAATNDPGKPVFPSRSVVPDAAGTPTANGVAGAAPKNPEGSLRSLPTDPSAVAKPADGAAPIGSFKAGDVAGTDLKPLANYRDRFRWPN